MKRLILVMLTLAAFGALPAMAADTYSKPGTLTAQAGLGLYWGLFGGFDLQGGVDYGITQFDFAPVFPLDVGASGRVGFGSWGGLAGGVYGTAHYSWKSLGTSFDWLNRLESYIGIGVEVLPSLGLSSYSGSAYHFDNHLAAFLEYDAIGGGTVLGASYKF